MSINLPNNDCQAFRIKCLSAPSDTPYITFGAWHDIPTYTTLGNQNTAAKFVRFKVGSSGLSDYSGEYVIMDEHGQIFTFNYGPIDWSRGKYSFALQAKWQKDVYQKFEMGEMGKQSPIKVPGDDDIYVSRFSGKYDNQILIGPNQDTFICEPVSGTQFVIPELTTSNLPDPTPPEETTDIAWKSRSIIPRFLIPSAHLLDKNPLSNPFYLIDEGEQWCKVNERTNRTGNEIKFSYTESSGVSEELSKTVYQETSIEMTASVGGALKAFDLSLSMAVSQTWGWSSTVTSAWTKEKSSTVDIPISAMKRLYIYQKVSVLKLMPLKMDTEAIIGLLGLDNYQTIDTPLN